MVRRWFEVTPVCPACAFRLLREEGYFTGAMALNLVLAGILFLIGFLVTLVLTLPDPPVVQMQLIGGTFMVVFPIVFWPFSKTFWIALDLTLDPKKANDLAASLNGKSN